MNRQKKNLCRATALIVRTHLSLDHKEIMTDRSKAGTETIIITAKAGIKDVIITTATTDTTEKADISNAMVVTTETTVKVATRDATTTVRADINSADRIIEAASAVIIMLAQDLSKDVLCSADRKNRQDHYSLVRNN